MGRARIGVWLVSLSKRVGPSWVPSAADHWPPCLLACVGGSCSDLGELAWRNWSIEERGITASCLTNALLKSGACITGYIPSHREQALRAL